VTFTHDKSALLQPTMMQSDSIMDEMRGEVKGPRNGWHGDTLTWTGE
jgi:hypothetical protein